MSVRILIADDSTTMRKILLRTLAAAGITSAIEAADGDEAVAQFKPGQFDLVLADWRMPGRTGIEVASQIRGQDGQVPIVLMATEIEPYPEADAAVAGVTDRLIKPFSPEAVRDLLARHCATASKTNARSRRIETAPVR